MKFNSLKFEISILYTAILGLILIVFSGILFLISHAFLQQIDQQLKVKAQAVDSTIRSYLNVLGESHDNLAQAVGKTLAMKNENFLQFKTWKISQKWMVQAKSLNLDKDYINFINKDATEVFSSANLDKDLRVLFLEDSQFPRRSQVIFWTLKVGHVSIRIINYLFTDNAVGRYLIQIGVPQDPLMQRLRDWMYSIALLVPLMLLMTNFVGRLLADRILKPVYEITDLAKRITHQDLSARIKTKHFGREMESLIESFNGMIAGLESSFHHIEQFSYHVAHELKTPLTIIQGEANLLLRRDRAIHEYKKALGIILEESQRVLKTFDDLLLLTKLGYQPEVFKFSRFDFMEFFSEIVEQNRMLAANKRITIRLDSENITGPLMINGDRLHLRRLFFNIIDNAMKFSMEGGSVDLRVEHSHGKIISFITDSGPGISPEKMERIIEKLHHGDKNIPGNGLGLCIASSIAKLHQGEIQVESVPGHGATFKVILPVQN